MTYHLDFTEHYLEKNLPRALLHPDSRQYLELLESAERILSFARGDEIALLHLFSERGYTLDWFRAARTHTVKTTGLEEETKKAAEARNRGHRIISRLEESEEQWDFIWCSNRALPPAAGQAGGEITLAGLYRRLKPAGILWLRLTETEKEEQYRLLLEAEPGSFGTSSQESNAAEIDKHFRRCGFEPVEASVPAPPWLFAQSIEKDARGLPDEIAAEHRALMEELMDESRQAARLRNRLFAQLIEKLRTKTGGRARCTDIILHKPDLEVIQPPEAIP